MKKISILIIALLCLASVVDAQAPAAPAPAAGAAPAANKGKITQFIKKANRRTPMEILKDIQENREDKTNWIVFIRDDATNQQSSKNNAQEVAMYEKFFANLSGEKPWDGCTLLKNITADAVEVTDPLAEELLKKLGLNKDKEFNKRTVTVVMRNGNGQKIQGPTAYLKLADELKGTTFATLQDANGGC